MTTLVVSLIFSLTGAAWAVFVATMHARPEYWAWLVVAAAAGNYLTALPTWRLMVRPGREGFWRGLMAGGVVGLLAHPVTWCLFVWGYVSGSHRDPAESIGSQFYSFWDLLIM